MTRIERQSRRPTVSRFWDDIPIVQKEVMGVVTFTGSHQVPKPDYTVSDIAFLNTPCNDCDACTAMPKGSESQACYAAGLCLFRQAVLAGWVSAEVYRDIASAGPYLEDRCECGASIIGTNFRTVCRSCRAAGCMVCTETLPRRFCAEHPFCRACDTDEVDEACKPLEPGCPLHTEWAGVQKTLKSLGLDKVCYLREQIDLGWEDFIDQLQGVLGPMSFGAHELWGPEAP